MINIKRVNNTLLFAILLITMPQFVSAQSTVDSLIQYTAELQKAPDDAVLKEKIISLSLRI